MKSFPYISNIELNNGESISLQRDGVLAVVGPNNAGKTYFLKSIRSHLHGVTVEEVPPEKGAIASISLKWHGSAESAAQVLRSRTEHFYKKAGDSYMPNNGVNYPRSGLIRGTDFNSQYEKKNLLGPFTDLFLQFDDALERINETKLQRQIRPGNGNNPSLTQVVREKAGSDHLVKFFFKQIFRRDISYYDQGFGDIGFLLAPELDKGSIMGGALSENTRRHMETEPKLWLQGLGMRSVLGLLLRIFAGDKEIIIIDEPEAFLHPPQASALGTVLAEIAAAHGKQIILATHDRNILNGLSKKHEHRVIIQKLTRQDEIPMIQEISTHTLNDVRSRSLVRYSTLFDSLFTQLTVLVENEKDAYFYSEALQHLLESQPEDFGDFTIDDVLFLSTSGKGGLGRSAELVSSLNSKVVVACDFDLLADPQHFQTVVAGVQTSSEVSENLQNKYFELMEEVFDNINVEQKVRDQQFRTVKNAGVNYSEGCFSQKAIELLGELDEVGVCLNHMGELEDFSPSLVGRRTKSEWANLAIQQDVHKGAEAQFFAKRILSSSIGTTEAKWDDRTEMHNS